MGAQEYTMKAKMDFVPIHHLSWNPHTILFPTSQKVGSASTSAPSRIQPFQERRISARPRLLSIVPVAVPL